VLSSILSDCRCFHPLYLDQDRDRAGFGPCNLESGTTDNTCVAAVLEQLGTETRVCNCSAACNGTDYEIDLSTAVWPSKKYLDAAKRNYGFEQNNSEGSEEPPPIGENLLKINVYYDSMSLKTIKETASYPGGILGSAFLSGLGGVLSLFLGISFAMLFEVFELLLDLILNGSNYVLGRSLGRSNHLF